MSAIEMQSLLARLYVDEYCRLLFRYKPTLVLEDYALTEAEEQALLAIDVDRLDLHALGLVSKREQHLRPHFRLLFGLNDLLDERPIEHLTKRFHGLHPATPEIGEVVEVRLFGAFIAQSLQGNPSVPAYAAAIARYDLVRYEAARLHRSRDTSPNGHAYPLQPSGAISEDDVFSLSPYVRLVHLEYNAMALAAQLQRGHLPTEVTKKPTTAVLQNRDAKLKTFAVNGPTALLLQTIDGHRTVRACIEVVEASFGTPGLSDGIISVLRQLEGATVLARVPATSASLMMKRRAS